MNMKYETVTHHAKSRSLRSFSSLALQDLLLHILSMVFSNFNLLISLIKFYSLATLKIDHHKFCENYSFADCILNFGFSPFLLGIITNPLSSCLHFHCWWMISFLDGHFVGHLGKFHTGGSYYSKSSSSFDFPNPLNPKKFVYK